MKKLATAIARENARHPVLMTLEAIKATERMIYTRLKVLDKKIAFAPNKSERHDIERDELLSLLPALRSVLEEVEVVE